MPDMMAEAATFVADQLSDNLSQDVTYRRGGLEVDLAATKCPVRAESDGQVNEDIANCDWIIKASLLVLGSETVEPQKNDVIEEADGQKWQVLPLANEPEFRPTDPYGTAFRIHTKRTNGAD